MFHQESFQYISCYSLSPTTPRNWRMQQSFNTSHVTLYRILPDKSAFIPFGFNTSHVTLYQNIRLTRIKLSVCFNTSHVTLYQHDQEDVMQKLMFQYISCYSLSQKHQQKRRTKLVSIHLMLLFISFADPDPTSFSRFQYISCYSLSTVEKRLRVCKEMFQYISCYSLST